MVSSQVRREQVALAIERGHSKRRACELIQISRTVLGYRPTGPQRDAPVIDAMRRLARLYPRFGYRRVRIFLKREGHEMSWARAH
jgi:putative transposase